MALKLNVVTTSTRPGRAGPKVSEWFANFATTLGNFEVELVDLASFNLPLLDEAKHPVLQQYAHEHTKAWAASCASADAFVFVTPEYDYFPPATLVNALQCLSREWAHKACGFVGYGGVSGAMRAVQAVKPLVTTLNMMPMVGLVTLPMFSTLIGEDGKLTSNALIDKSATDMLNELHRWATALRTIRHPAG
ncbi:hypothetical protein sos41_25880 [Alphaproteobacteria bacterium SO-S41]|nr:hypothetical protein sos41_25880 [Alphaproteobacteria bacterium SO-S41]